MRRLAMVVAFSCAACSLISDLTDLSGPADSAIDTKADTTIPSDAGDDRNAYDFRDDFERPDSATVGNGWIGKNPAFQISSGRALRVNQSAIDFRDLMVYRQSNEAYLDVQASVEVTLAGVDSGEGAWEQLHVRIQPSTIAQPNTLDDYSLFAQNGGTTAMNIARCRGQAAYAVLGTFQLAEAMVAGTTYRFTLRTTGAGPVSLYASVERFDSPAYTMLGSTVIEDTDSANAITTPGVVGFSASNSDPTGAFAYDNFIATGN